MLHDRALIVYVTISQWTGRKRDKSAAQIVALHKAAQETAGNYNKKLLPESKELAAIASKATKLRTFVYENSLPWMSDGGRIVAADEIMDFSAQFQTLRNEYETAVEDFLREYELSKDLAALTLGELYSKDDYPAVDSLRRKFKCSMTVVPVPSEKDFRVELPEEFKTQLREGLVEVEKQAINDCVERILERVKAAVVRLSDPKAVLHKSAIENLRDIAAQVSKLNVTQSAELESLRQEVETLAAGVETEQLRGDAALRQETAEKLRKIQNSVSGLFGGNQ